MAELARDGAGLGNLLGFEALAFEHVLEVRVAAEIELVGAIQAHPALAKQVCQHAMDEGSADLRLDVVADDRQARSEEHTSELPSLMRISYAVFSLQTHKKQTRH